MKLYYDRKSKNPTYFIQMGIRNGKKVTTRNVYTIGKHQDLIKEGHDDPLEYAKQFCKEYNEKIASGKVDMSLTIDFNQKLKHTDNISSDSTSLNIGYFFLQEIYSKLKIKEFLDSIMVNKSVKFNYNDINRFTIFDRILYPHSKLQTVNNLHKYYENPNFTHQQVLRFMDILSDNFDNYLSHLFENSNNVIKRDTSVCYYDCTNFYFEIEQEDPDYFDDVTGELLPGFRRYGPSKDKKNTPLVEMGLFMDKDGIPITMGLFPGNTNEQKTVHGLETKMLKMFKNKKIIYCGDAGLGSLSIRVFNDMGGKAFIITQSIKKLNEALQFEVFNDKNYKLLSSGKPYSLKKMKDFKKDDEKNLELYNDKVYKVIDVDTTVDLGLFEEKEFKNGNTKFIKSKANLKQRIIITFSRKVMEYQRKIREGQIERAKAIIANKSVEDKKKGPNDVTRFIKSNKEKKDEYILDEDRIELEKRYDGFYAIATNLMDEDVKEIININSNRYKIEDCFRVMKTNFEARPAYHRLPPRLNSHFLFCYTALLIYRLLETKLNRYDTTKRLSINNIIRTLQNMNVANVEDLFYTALFTSSDTCTNLNGLFNLGLDKKYYRNSELSKKIKKI